MTSVSQCRALWEEDDFDSSGSTTVSAQDILATGTDTGTYKFVIESCDGTGWEPFLQKHPKKEVNEFIQSKINKNKKPWQR